MKNKYTHVERLSSPEVEGILLGKCYIYPKIDGSNASIEMDEYGTIIARSRKNVLTESNNLNGFYSYVKDRHKLLTPFFNCYPDIILYGEWLTPHTIKTYKQSAWNKFYVFDFYDKATDRYLNFETFKQIFGMDYDLGVEFIPALAKIVNPTEDQLLEVMNVNSYLLESGTSEGIVIKNYGFENKYGRQSYAKLTTDFFTSKHNSQYKKKPSEMLNEDFEKNLVYKLLTDEYVLKELNKLLGEVESNLIGIVINNVYNEFIRDYIHEILSKYKDPTINFRNLRKAIRDYVVGVLLPLKAEKPPIDTEPSLV